jgi:hypothetical protein
MRRGRLCWRIRRRPTNHNLVVIVVVTRYGVVIPRLQGGAVGDGAA